MVTDPKVKFLIWSLENLTEWEIRPKCFANLPTTPDPGFQSDAQLNITVYKPSDSVSISVVNHIGPMLEWEQYQLQCKVQNIAPVQYLTVKWYKGETLENQTSYDALTKTPVNVSSTLLITPTSADDGAQYSCVAELELGPEGPQPPPSTKSDPLNIPVHHKPRITECLGHVKLREGESLDTLVSCRAEGNPSPVVTWYRNQSEFNSSTQLTRRDAGQYVMMAKNTLGSVSVNFTVGYPPSEIFELESDAVDLGASVVLKCSSQGNPQPRYNWTYPRAANVQENSVDGVSWLHISNASEENNGSYTCYAQNRIGHVNKTVSLIVRGKNTTTTVCSIKMEPSTVVVRYGDPVSVNCTVSGDHEGIGWNASEGPVDMVSGVKFVTWSLETLTDWKIRPKCYAKNKTGFQCDETLNITVYKPPDSVSISAVNHTGPMLEGEQYQLQCEVLNIAPVQYLTVKWYKGKTLENQTSYNALTKTPVNVSSTLLITPTSADDGAQYSCVAELELGPEGPQPPPSSISDPLSITVNYAPIFYGSINETLEVAEGQNIALNCSAMGNPLPEYSWSSPHNEEENTRETLITSTSLPLGTHVYTCNAKNDLGESRKYFTVKVVVIYCPIKMEPSTVVVRYRDPVSVNCTISGDGLKHDGFDWEASEGSVDMVPDQFVIWSVKALTVWEIRPKCYANMKNFLGFQVLQCDETLNITVYKPPDSVSISAMNHAGPMLEGKQYQLQCEVQNIAPVQYLTVKWYKGETLENQTSYDNLTKTPVNVSPTLLITPTSADDGAQYRCVAELELGPEGPQPPPSHKSDPLNITVNYAPIFSVSNETLKVAEREEVTLNCSAVGNPLPEYSWSPPHNEEKLITSLSPGTHVYTCNAKNYLGESTKYFTVEVIAIVDYLPLIAGIVALVVVCISIAFVFIYLIYYKNTKMGEYNLKLGKSRAQNAHVAQNGRDSSLPMKKLTKPSLPV